MSVGIVVVNADDLGVSRGATLGIIEAHERGVVTSASLAVTTPHYEHAVHACVRACPALGIGLHFTLTSGRPAADAAHVPLLVDRNGFFRWRFTSLLRAMRGRERTPLAEQINVELDAQLARVRADGVRVDHIDGERHIHIIPGIFALVVAAARRNDIHFVRAGFDAGYRFLRMAHVPGVALHGGVVKSALLGALSRRARTHLGNGVRSADYVASYLHTGRADLIMSQILAAPPASAITEIMVHPGIPAESANVGSGNPELERYLRADDRQRELAACITAKRGNIAGRLANFSQLAATPPIAS